MSDLTFEQKINCITESNNLGELPLDAMPYSQDDEYYFISYSHLDYKYVYTDILRLQSKGLSIWYDRGMPAGKNWRDVAEDALSKPSCIGVIFYVSQNSLTSGAVHEEIDLAKKYGKDLLSINIPILKDGKEILCSASQMLDLISEQIPVDEEKKRIISNTFSNDVIYLSIYEDTNIKVEKIKLLKPPEQIIYEYYDSDRYSYARVKALKTIQLKNVSIPATVKKDGRNYTVNGIENCAFANAKKLETVRFEGSVLIGENAFFGCENLNRFKAKRINGIAANAFFGCENLEVLYGEIDGDVGKHAFFGCKKLSAIELGFDFQVHTYEAFVGSGIKRFYVGAEGLNSYAIREGCLYDISYSKEGSAIIWITPDENGILTVPMGSERIEYGSVGFKENVKTLRLPYSMKTIGDHAFSRFENLENIEFYGDPESLPELKIGNGSFSGCKKLKKFLFPKNLSSLGYGALANNTELCEIIFPESMGISELSDGCFASCHQLRRISIPSYITAFGHKCFNDCFRLESVKLEEPVSLSMIGSQTFGYCYNIQSMTLPKSLKTVLSDAFSKCINLKKLVFEGTMAEWNLAYTPALFGGEIPRVDCIDGVDIKGSGEFETMLYAEEALNENADKKLNTKPD